MVHVSSLHIKRRGIVAQDIIDDGEYAHIDGGPDNPGYFTEKPAFVPGDANGDGKVDVRDALRILEIIAVQQ